MAKKNFSQMIQSNKTHYCYNDGYAHLLTIEIVRNANEVKIGEKTIEIGKLPFANVNVRDNDNIIADSLGYTIDKKIRVPFVNVLENIKVKINNGETIYDIVKRDSSDNINLYLYLQKASNEGVENSD